MTYPRQTAGEEGQWTQFRAVGVVTWASTRDTQVTGQLSVDHGRLLEGSKVMSRKNFILGPTLDRTPDSVPGTSSISHATAALTLEQVVSNLCTQEPDFGQE